MSSKYSCGAVERSDVKGKAIVSVDPFRCQMWAHPDRLEEHLSEKNCSAEIESYSRHGQLIPVLGRRLRNDLNYEVELIYGARRLFVARHLRTPLLVELREMTDHEAVIAMEIENHHRTETSPYERGLCFARWLSSKLFESQDDIARTLNISKSQVSRYLKLTKLPSVILSAFPSPTEICESWGLDLVEAWQDSERQEVLARSAKEVALSHNRLSSREVYQFLIDSSPPPDRRPSKFAKDEVVRGKNGDALFRIRHQHDSITVLLPLDRMSKESLQEARSFLRCLLQHETEQLTEN